MWLSNMFALVVMVFGYVMQCQSINIKVGILLVSNATRLPFDLLRMGGAIVEGFMVAARDYNVTFEPIYCQYSGYNDCPTHTTLGCMAELYFLDKVQAIIGPSCSYSIIGTGRLAEYLKLPMLSGQGGLLLRDHVKHDLYRTTSILSYKMDRLTKAIAVVLKKYEYKHVVVMYDSTTAFTTDSGLYMVQTIYSDGYFEKPLTIPFLGTMPNEYASLLLEAKRRARVFIIFVPHVHFRRLLYTAYTLGMANGDYVFLTVELFPSSWMGFYMEFLTGDSMDYGVTRAYESVLIIRLPGGDSPVFTNFSTAVIKRAKDQFGYTYPPNEKVSYFAASYYDCVMYLANAYNMTLTEGGNINDGYAIARKFWNSSFPGLLGTVAMSAEGDRLTNFELFDMILPTTPMVQPTSTYFRLVGVYNGVLEKYIEQPGVPIVWMNGKPVDIPPCGFDDICPQQDTHTVVIATVVPLTFVLCLIGIFGCYNYRKYQEHRRIERKSWLVEFHEIRARKGKFNDSFISKSYLKVAEEETEVSDSVCKTAFCRNRVVAQKKLVLPLVDISWILETECRQMQAISHDNLAKFIGVCLEPGNICILMEYCQRGNLQDIILSSGIELHWGFKFSMIQDIIQGMVYLHGSPIKVHGSLSSSNCVIDSRFALKITDYGPISILMMHRAEEKSVKIANGSFNKQQLLWTAPEHLRSTTMYNNYSQKGDVYSFSIILQEIALRQEPFESNDMEVDDILDRLINRPGTMRPEVNPEACSPELLNIMKQCWRENPAERPSFSDVEDTFKKMRRGHSSNVMDQLIERMSNYADNLEQLAADRAKAYMDEKKKAEELLNKLLPEEIAKQLQMDQIVRPEAFKCVTVYFSDIVGFPAICSVSLPIEVVDLLNDIYRALDDIMARFKVYKVETIVDAYMCVSGLPTPIGDCHVAEMSSMALSVLHIVRNFKIVHMPQQVLQCRIGLHSGPVVAGVIGYTSPRYCLFGDTINIASRMVSNSERFDFDEIVLAGRTGRKYSQKSDSSAGAQVDIDGIVEMPMYEIIKYPFCSLKDYF